MKYHFYPGTLSSAGFQSLLAVFALTFASMLYAADTDIAKLKTMAEKGDAQAQSALGNSYLTGKGVRMDVAEAAKWWRRAAEQGHPLAQTSIGTMYLNGYGVRKDPEEAFKWYRKAAEQGLSEAQLALGRMYHNGDGIQQNFGEAAKWLLAAAEQGHAEAQCFLGLMYLTGTGLPKNNVEGYKWVNLAAANGNKMAAKVRAEVEQEMTPGQIAEAQRLSAAWQPKSSSQTDETRPSLDQRKQSPKQAEQQSQYQAGTGFIVSGEGHVLTNHHVVEGCTKIACDLGGKATLLSVVQTDARSDLALLKLNNPGHRPLKFRDGKSIRSGDGIVVVGYPLQELLANQAHVTTGTVSAMAGPGNDTRIFQITAPVQPGNSGGPVLDVAGNVVGIATAKLNAIKTAKLTGDFPQNVNFAINAAVVKAFLDASGVDYESSSSNKKLEASEIGEMAKKGSLFIVCSKE